MGRFDTFGDAFEAQCLLRSNQNRRRDHCLGQRQRPTAGVTTELAALLATEALLASELSSLLSAETLLASILTSLLASELTTCPPIRFVA